jgi:hypothetical protein
MSSDSEGTRECPYCKEDIQAEAVKCKHCGSRLTPQRPGHGGTCPFCKEEIHPDAIKCKHCKSIVAGKDSDCGCGEDSVFSHPVDAGSEGFDGSPAQPGSSVVFSRRNPRPIPFPTPPMPPEGYPCYWDLDCFEQWQDSPFGPIYVRHCRWVRRCRSWSF